MMLIIILLMIPIIFMMLNLFLYKKYTYSREKLSPFECGFDPMNNNRSPFSIHFFMISLIFLIFDIEITLLIPIPISIFKLNLFTVSSSLIFMIILMWGLLIEYSDQSIDWKI